MRRNVWVFVILGVALLLFAIQNRNATLPPHEQTVAPGDRRDFLFCFWNVENFFDDKDDGRKGAGDKDYDPWLAHNPEVMKLKLARLTEVLLNLNDGRGPDILALCEVESERSVELLQLALNAQLKDPALHYQKPVMKEINGFRHIAPAVLTRLPVVRDRTRTLDKRLRIVECQLALGDRPLTIIAGHWSSRIRESGEKGRDVYADKIYGRANAIFQAEPSVDLLVCGDFNDTPDDVSVQQHLHSTGELHRVRSARGQLELFNLFAGKDPAQFGTHYYQGWFIFDQVLVSPGLLDEKGWTCHVDSARTVNHLHKPSDRLKRPWRFGSPKENGKQRGYSDHFPVTVRLKVDGPPPDVTARRGTRPDLVVRTR